MSADAFLARAAEVNRLESLLGTGGNMNKTIEQTLYSLDAMAEDAEADGNTDRARLMRTCGTLLRVEIVRLADRVEHLRGGLKWCSGRLLDANDMEAADMALEMAGDMEPNARLSRQGGADEA